MSFSFIHIADIHLGRPFSDLSLVSGQEEICADAAKKSFEKIINLATEKRVNFVLIAGDSFDSDEHDLGTKLTFIRNLKKLADNGIKSYVICGNHDPISMYKKYENYFRKESKHLEEYGNDINPKTYEYQRRCFGYLAERLLSSFIITEYYYKGKLARTVLINEKK